MNKIELVFKEKVNDISFLELKENTSMRINDYLIAPYLPLPVLTSKLVSDIKKGNLENEINLKNIIEGIVYLAGADTEFRYLKEYKEILYAYNANIAEYIFYNGMKFLEEKDFINAGIYLRALLVIDPKNSKARFNYALILEGLGKKDIGANRIEEGEELIASAVNELEKILKIDENYSLAHYKLGYFYKYIEQYLKAQITWKNFLVLDKDESRLQEIREELDGIEDNVRFETGITYLNYNEFSKAVEYFLKLLPKYKDDFNTNFLIGLCFKGMGEYNSAMEYLNKAYELNPTDENVIIQRQDMEELFNNR